MSEKVNAYSCGHVVLNPFSACLFRPAAATTQGVLLFHCLLVQCHSHMHSIIKMDAFLDAAGCDLTASPLQSSKVLQLILQTHYEGYR